MEFENDITECCENISFLTIILLPLSLNIYKSIKN